MRASAQLLCQSSEKARTSARIFCCVFALSSTVIERVERDPEKTSQLNRLRDIQVEHLLRDIGAITEKALPMLP